MGHKFPPIKVRIAILVFLIIIFSTIYFISKYEGDLKKIETTGSIEVKEIDISSRVSSRINKIYYDEGSQVKKGDVLIELENNVQESQFKAAEKLFSNAKKNYERAIQLYKENAISKQQFEQAEATFLSAKANYEQAKVIYEDTMVKAPWDGIILKRYVEEGELVAANTPLLSLGDLETVKVIFYVSLRELGKIKLNQKVNIQIDSFKNKVYEGKITYISDKAEFTPKNIQTKDERVKQVFEIEATVKNDNFELKPGMPCDVRINF